MISSCLTPIQGKYVLGNTYFTYLHTEFRSNGMCRNVVWPDMPTFRTIVMPLHSRAKKYSQIILNCFIHKDEITTILRNVRNNIPTQHHISDLTWRHLLRWNLETTLKLALCVNIISYIYKVVQIWPGQSVTCLHTNSHGHIWTTLYYWVRLN